LNRLCIEFTESSDIYASKVIGVQIRVGRSGCRANLITIFFPILQALPGQQTPDGVPSFKLVLVGDGGTGKRAYRSEDRCSSRMAAVERIVSS
jgi:hypothetical protein